MQLLKLQNLCQQCEKVQMHTCLQRSNFPIDSLSKLNHDLPQLTHYYNTLDLPLTLEVKFFLTNWGPRPSGPRKQAESSLFQIWLQVPTTLMDMVDYHKHLGADFIGQVNFMVSTDSGQCSTWFTRNPHKILANLILCFAGI